MKTYLSLVPVSAWLAAAVLQNGTATAQMADPGWPRVFQQAGQQLTIYQPQVDYWHGYTNTHFRCAIAVKGVLKEERYGVVEVDAVTVVDQPDRLVVLVPTQRNLRFPNTSDAEAAALRTAVDTLRPPGQAITISLDRVLAFLNPADQPTQPPVALNLDPPKIFYSRQPSILVTFLGEPQFKPVAPDRTDLMFALNSNWDIFYDTATQRYLLLNQNSWLAAPDVKGPWLAIPSLPTSLYRLPDNDNWSAVRQNLPGIWAQTVPVVFVSTQPAELIQTHGEPSYRPIPGTQLLSVANTDSVVFLNSGDANFYYLVAGRWFRAASLDGPWSAASQNLPADFARIPDNDPAAFVKASVPGTRDAQDAVLLASVPRSTTVNLTNVTVQVVYNGPPQFTPIPNCTVQYAVNSPYSVLFVGGSYYCCDRGIWFISSAAAGPWAFCTSVPPVIYTIPPTCPIYNVTYVTVQNATPTTVVYAQTGGYSGQYVAATGVLMFGAGLAVGAILANNSSHYYCYPPPTCYSYGCGAVYHYGYGSYYYKGAAAYGPYGGASYSTAYNPSTGTYSRSASAYGPYGSASATRTYNPYTGTATASRSVSTPYGTASQGAAYNSKTGARAAGSSVSTAYGSASRGAAYNPTTGNAAWGGSRSSSYGSASAAQTSQGGGAASWNTANSQGSVAKTQSGNVYASSDGTVYKKNSNGSWSQNSGSGWESTTKPQPNSYNSSYNANSQSQASSYQQKPTSSSSTYNNSSSANRPAQASSYQNSYQPSGSSTKPSGSASGSSDWSQKQSSMESQAQARNYGNQQSQKAESWGGYSGGSRESGGGGWGGGGGGRRR